MGFTKKSLKVLAAFFAVLFLTENVFLIHAAETNLWSARQKAVKALENPSASSGQADLAQTASNPQMLLASLPKADAGHVLPMSGKALADLGISANLALENKAALASRVVPTWMSEAIAPFATIHEITLSKNANAKTILLMQDAHMHFEAQTNIAGTVDALARALEKKGSSLLVGMEGADVPVADFSPYNQVAFRQEMHAVSQALLKINILNGIEAAALGYLGDGSDAAVKLPFTVTGVEKKEEYWANVKALQDAAPFQPKAQKALDLFKRNLVEMKKKHYSSDMMAFDQKLTGYQEGTVGVPEYALFLDSIEHATSPNLKQLTQAALLENSLNFDNVERERTKILETLVPKISDAETKRLLQYSALYQAGEITYSGYYDHLKKVCAAHGISFANYPEMNLYVQYILKSEAIDGAQLMKELESLEAAVLKKLATTKEEETIASLQKDFYLMGKLADHSMTEDEWHLYESRRAGIEKLGDRFAAVGSSLPKELKDSQTWWDVYEAFYHSAIARNETMSTNIATRLASADTKTALFVVGGFHTQGLLRELKNHNLNVLTLSPKITQVEEGSLSSVDVLSSGRMPLDRLFAGERLFVAVASGVTGMQGPDAAQEILEMQVGAANVARTGKPFNGTSESVTEGSESNSQFNVLDREGNVRPMRVVRKKASFAKSFAKRAGHIGMELMVVGGITLIATAISAAVMFGVVTIAQVGIGAAGLALLVLTIWGLKRSGKAPKILLTAVALVGLSGGAVDAQQPLAGVPQAKIQAEIRNEFRSDKKIPSIAKIQEDRLKHNQFMMQLSPQNRDNPVTNVEMEAPSQSSEEPVYTWTMGRKNFFSKYGGNINVRFAVPLEGKDILEFSILHRTYAENAPHDVIPERDVLKTYIFVQKEGKWAAYERIVDEKGIISFKPTYHVSIDKVQGNFEDIGEKGFGVYVYNEDLLEQDGTLVAVAAKTGEKGKGSFTDYPGKLTSSWWWWIGAGALLTAIAAGLHKLNNRPVGSYGKWAPVFIPFALMVLTGAAPTKDTSNFAIAGYFVLMLGVPVLFIVARNTIRALRQPRAPASSTATETAKASGREKPFEYDNVPFAMQDYVAGLDQHLTDLENAFNSLIGDIGSVNHLGVFKGLVSELEAIKGLTADIDANNFDALDAGLNQIAPRVDAIRSNATFTGAKKSQREQTYTDTKGTKRDSVDAQLQAIQARVADIKAEIVWLRPRMVERVRRPRAPKAEEKPEAPKTRWKAPEALTLAAYANESYRYDQRGHGLSRMSRLVDQLLENQLAKKDGESQYVASLRNGLTRVQTLIGNSARFLKLGDDAYLALLGEIRGIMMPLITDAKIKAYLNDARRAELNDDIIAVMIYRRKLATAINNKQARVAEAEAKRKGKLEQAEAEAKRQQTEADEEAATAPAPVVEEPAAPAVETPVAAQPAVVEVPAQTEDSDRIEPHGIVVGNITDAGYYFVDLTERLVSFAGAMDLIEGADADAIATLKAEVENALAAMESADLSSLDSMDDAAAVVMSMRYALQDSPIAASNAKIFIHGYDFAVNSIVDGLFQMSMELRGALSILSRAQAKAAADAVAAKAKEEKPAVAEAPAPEAVKPAQTAAAKPAKKAKATPEEKPAAKPTLKVNSETAETLLEKRADVKKLKAEVKTLENATYSVGLRRTLGGLAIGMVVVAIGVQVVFASLLITGVCAIGAVVFAVWLNFDTKNQTKLKEATAALKIAETELEEVTAVARQEDAGRKAKTQKLAEQKKAKEDEERQQKAAERTAARVAAREEATAGYFGFAYATMAGVVRKTDFRQGVLKWAQDTEDAAARETSSPVSVRPVTVPITRTRGFLLALAARAAESAVLAEGLLQSINPGEKNNEASQAAWITTVRPLVRRVMGFSAANGLNSLEHVLGAARELHASFDNSDASKPVRAFVGNSPEETAQFLVGMYLLGRRANPKLIAYVNRFLSNEAVSAEDKAIVRRALTQKLEVAIDTSVTIKDILEYSLRAQRLQEAFKEFRRNSNSVIDKAKKRNEEKADKSAPLPFSADNGRNKTDLIDKPSDDFAQTLAGLAAGVPAGFRTIFASKVPNAGNAFAHYALNLAKATRAQNEPNAQTFARARQIAAEMTSEATRPIGSVVRSVANNNEVAERFLTRARTIPPLSGRPGIGLTASRPTVITPAPIAVPADEPGQSPAVRSFTINENDLLPEVVGALTNAAPATILGTLLRPILMHGLERFNQRLVGFAFENAFHEGIQTQVMLIIQALHSGNFSKPTADISDVVTAVLPIWRDDQAIFDMIITLYKEIHPTGSGLPNVGVVSGERQIRDVIEYIEDALVSADGKKIMARTIKLAILPSSNISSHVVEPFFRRASNGEITISGSMDGWSLYRVALTALIRQQKGERKLAEIAFDEEAAAGDLAQLIMVVHEVLEGLGVPDVVLEQNFLADADRMRAQLGKSGRLPDFLYTRSGILARAARILEQYRFSSAANATEAEYWQTLHERETAAGVLQRLSIVDRTAPVLERMLPNLNGRTVLRYGNLTPMLPRAAVSITPYMTTNAMDLEQKPAKAHDNLTRVHQNKHLVHEGRLEDALNNGSLKRPSDFRIVDIANGIDDLYEAVLSARSDRHARFGIIGTWEQLNEKLDAGDQDKANYIRAGSPEQFFFSGSDELPYDEATGYYDPTKAIDALMAAAAKAQVDTQNPWLISQRQFDVEALLLWNTALRITLTVPIVTQDVGGKPFKDTYSYTFA